MSRDESPAFPLLPLPNLSRTGLLKVVRTMRPVPFDKGMVLRLAILIALPLLPLILTMIPLEELVQRLIKLLV